MPHWVIIGLSARCAGMARLARILRRSRMSESEGRFIAAMLYLWDSWSELQADMNELGSPNDTGAQFRVLAESWITQF
jgi:hypothetical protein